MFARKFSSRSATAAQPDEVQTVGALLLYHNLVGLGKPTLMFVISQIHDVNLYTR
jgi:hypothetical protein